MSKQSEVEEAIKTCIAIEQSCGEFDGNRLTSQILRCLKELQVVIKVKRKLPFTDEEFLTLSTYEPLIEVRK